MSNDKTKLCESCHGTGREDDSPRYAGDVDDDVPYAVPASKCKTCDGKGRVPLCPRKIREIVRHEEGHEEVIVNPLAFLRDLGADKIPHGHRTLLQHLEGTERIVRHWGADEDTCKAALFHSIYGTEFFKSALLVPDSSNRGRVGDVIGPVAERIVLAFCTMERQSVYDAVRDSSGSYYVRWHDNHAEAPIKLSKNDFKALVQILWANALEQAPSQNRPKDRALVERCAKFLSPVALRELRSYTASIESLLGTSEVRPTLKNWPNENFVRTGHVERLDGLADFSFDDVVDLPRQYARAFTSKGEHMNIGQGEERTFYDSGHTIYWHSLHSPTIDSWIAAIDADLGLVPGATRVSGFASKHGASIPTHYDPNDNFTVQARGRKVWRVSYDRVLYPTVGATMGVKPTAVVMVESKGKLPAEMPDHNIIQLEPGDVMFTPRGTWHDTETSSDESLHFNVQCGLANWKDAVDFVLSTSLALHAPELRAPILLTPDFKKELQKRIRKAVANVSTNDFNAEAFRQFVIRRKVGST